MSFAFGRSFLGVVRVREHTMPDGVDARVLLMQPAVGEPPRDGSPTAPEPKELHPRDDPMLPARERRNRAIDTTVPRLCTHTVHKGGSDGIFAPSPALLTFAP